ncbi:ABC transporter ATP-binding protein [Phyllobacterium sp. YR531]|uniref:ABC transporter ATP-binding protein n=1 Tax=Phyllobacterium sp. YR531 TaxID=1144343 RepID=UPI00026F5BB8|nr:ABC transporter ATP-binding protein [Phyllobacterium sp. YR531]EJN00005.1 ABC-type cobalamin/Fe3+-siderophore transport system, ATPase component [Phyllobacterium sp. YR531]
MTAPFHLESHLTGANLALAYGKRLVCEELDIAIPTGGFTAIIGPNGCGKSTLLRALSRLLAPSNGQVLLDGKDIQSIPARDVAKRLGLLPQSAIAPAGITVSDLVSRGRYPHQTLLRQWSRADAEAVEQAMQATTISDLAERSIDELSGGQRQRVWVAMALAQDTPLLLLDEPTTFLDITHQIDLMDLFQDLNRNRGRTLVAVLHDLNQACRYATHLIAMREGRIIAEGTPREIVTAELVERVFDLSAMIIEDPVSGTPLVIPHQRTGKSVA